MKSVALAAFPRSAVKRSGVKKLRSTGRVPAVIYGRQNKPQNLEINVKDLEDLIHHSASENLLVDLSVGGDKQSKHLALVQEVQHHPLNGDILHVDLHEVAENEKGTVMVAVETVGEAAGGKAGGVLEHVLFKIKARALPKDLPEAIHVDVAHLEIGKSVHLGEIKPPPNVEILGNKEVVVISVAAPVTEEQEAAAAEAATQAAGDVEMIKEKKEEGVEGAAPAKGAAAPAKGAEKAPAEKGAEKTAGGEKAAEKGGEKKAEKKK